jgi:hypothetical protein
LEGIFYSDRALSQNFRTTLIRMLPCAARNAEYALSELTGIRRSIPATRTGE